MTNDGASLISNYQSPRVEASCWPSLSLLARLPAVIIGANSKFSRLCPAEMADASKLGFGISKGQNLEREWVSAAEGYEGLPDTKGDAQVRAIADRRNSLAHGDPFDGLPTGGLLELVRDLINFAYRSYFAEAASIGFYPTTAGRA